MKHAHLIPLVGGAAIGASLALQSKPEFIVSWSAFAKNDSFCKEYFKDVPFWTFDKTSNFKTKEVDIITVVPPCSGLSTATPNTARGCSAPQNEHMLISAEFAMARKTKAILIENAPTLYSKGGEEFANRFIPLIDRWGYSMQLVKTSSILHGLPQNRVRSFVILYKGKQIPEFEWIKKSFRPLNIWETFPKSPFATEWDAQSDEMISVLREYYNVATNKLLLKNISGDYSGNPMTAWKVLMDKQIRHHTFKTKPYKYMWDVGKNGKGIMDRSPYFVDNYMNALMWKSAHKMLNPAAPHRQFTIRELMNLMGLPKNFKEIPAKDINVLFQNVPVPTVKTMVEEIAMALDGQRKWYKPNEKITRMNNIKQQIEDINGKPIRR